jgi:hypothetical protein
MSQLKDSLKYMPDKALLETLHNSYRDLIAQRPQGKQDANLKGVVNELYRELIHRLSAPDSQNMSQLLLSQDFEGYEKESMTQIISQIERTYKGMYEKLLAATDIFAGKAIDDFVEKRTSGMAGYSNNTEWDFYNNLPGKQELDTSMAKGNAHSHFIQGDQITIHRELDIFHPAAQITGLSVVKNSLLNNGKKLPENSSWNSYRDKTVSAINTLKDFSSKTEAGSNFLAEMLKESSPYIRAFKDAVNYVGEGLGLGSPFTMSKTQEYKQILAGISSSLQIDNPIEQEEAVKKSPGL